MSDNVTDTPAEVDYAAKVKKMLDLAERASTEHERDVAMAKAHEFMEKYSIDEAMLADARKSAEPEEIGTAMLSFTGIFAQQHRELAIKIAYQSRCKVVLHDPYGRGKKTYRLAVHGFTSDMRRVEFLAASLQLQAVAAEQAWRKAQPSSWHTLPGFEKFKDRREFFSSFADGVNAKMRQANAAARDAAVAERVAEATRTGTETSDAEVRTGVELVLRDRTERVQDWYDKYYGDSLRTARRSSRASGSYSAASAGREAGRNADTGSTRVSGGRRQIGS